MVITGSKSSIGSTPLQLVAASTPIKAALLLQADSGNTSTTFFGYSPTITPGTTDATDGFPLAAGASITLSPSEMSFDASNVYVVAGGGSQKIHFKGQ